MSFQTIDEYKIAISNAIESENEDLTKSLINGYKPLRRKAPADPSYKEISMTEIWDEFLAQMLIKAFRKNREFAKNLESKINPEQLLMPTAMFGKLTIFSGLVDMLADRIDKWRGLDKLEFSLNRAAENGHIELIQYLINLMRERKWFEYFQDFNSWINSGLESALNKGQFAVSLLLIKEGAMLDNYGLVEASYGGNVELMKHLIQLGADVTVDNNMRAAAAYGQVEAIKFLLGLGLSIEGYPKERTPLIEASMHNHIEAVKFLVENGADISANNYEAIYRAGTVGFIKPGDRTEYDIISYLVDKAPNFRVTDNNLLARGILSRDLALVKKLVERGANVNAFKGAIFDEARRMGNNDIINYLNEIDK